MVNLKYSIVGLRQEADSVLLTLEKYREPPSLEEIERARLEAEMEPETDLALEEKLLKKLDLRPEPDSDEGKMVRKIFNAWKREVPGIFEMMTSFNDAPRMVAPLTPRMMLIRSPLEIWITNQEYMDLGSPSIFQVIEITLYLR